MWVPDLGRFLKLRKVGVSPYLVLFPFLNVLRMFRLNEAMRGRLIGPKSWDRIDTNFWKIKWSIRGCSTAEFGIKSVYFGVDHVLIGLEPEMPRKPGSLSEPTFF